MTRRAKALLKHPFLIRSFCVLVPVSLGTLGAPFEVDVARNSVIAKRPNPNETEIREELSGLQIPFVANAGQTDPEVAFYAPTLIGTAFVTGDGKIVYSVPKNVGSSRDRLSNRARAWSLTEAPVDGQARPIGRNPASTRVSYYCGDDPKFWKSGLATFEDVSLGEVWTGISLDLRAHAGGIEKIFTVVPGGDASRIWMNIAGARRLRIDHEGALVFETGLGQMTFTPPKAYQERRGVRCPVQAAYRIRGNRYGFRLATHDRALPVIIDPLLQATYLGGPGGDVVYSIAISPTTGDVYVAGSTSATGFPGTSGGFQPAHAPDSGMDDAFIARLSPTLTTLDQATYVGGKGEDFAYGVAIHPISGDVYVAGPTSSRDFPGTAGGVQPVNPSANCLSGFVVRLDPSLTTLKQATYLGGSGCDASTALAINPTSGDLLVAGATRSTDFPGAADGAQPDYSGDGDAFIARLSPSLTTIEQATYVGGSGDDAVNALAINPATGDVYVAGPTVSTNFPGTTGGAQTSHSADDGFNDAFVVRLSPSLTTLDQATYLGGNGDDIPHALAIDPTTDDVYVAGETVSTDFPGAAGGAQPVHGRGMANDGFIARLNSSLTRLDRATYLGGSSVDIVEALVIRLNSGGVYVAGQTSSPDFPGTSGGIQPDATKDTSHGFIAQLRSTLEALEQGTYLGGSNDDEAIALAFHPLLGDLYVAGGTASTDFPMTSGGTQHSHAGAFFNFDGFVARVSSLASQPCTGRCVVPVAPPPAAFVTGRRP